MWRKYRTSPGVNSKTMWRLKLYHKIQISIHLKNLSNVKICRKFNLIEITFLRIYDSYFIIRRNHKNINAEPIRRANTVLKNRLCFWTKQGLFVEPIYWRIDEYCVNGSFLAFFLFRFAFLTLILYVCTWTYEVLVAAM